MPPRGRGGRVRAGSPLRRTLKALQEQDAKEQRRAAAAAAARVSSKSEAVKHEAGLEVEVKKIEWTSKIYPAPPDGVEIPTIKLPFTEQEKADVRLLHEIGKDVRKVQWFLTADLEPPKYWTATEINATRLQLDKPSVWSKNSKVPEKMFPAELRAGREGRAIAKRRRRSMVRGSNLLTKEDLEQEDAAEAEDEDSEDEGGDEGVEDGEKPVDDDGDYGAGENFDDDDGYDDMDSGADEAIL